MSATVTTLDQKIIPYIKNICKRDPFSGGVVTGAANHRRARRQSGQLRGLLGDIAGNLRRLIHLSQHALVNIQLFQNLVGPAAVGDIQKLHP